MLFLWGSNKDKQLGIASTSTESQLDESENVYTPTLCSSLSTHTIAGVSCGSRHTLAFDNIGRVFSWGWGACGQLGHGDLTSQELPKQINSMADHIVTAISAGGMHSAAIVEGGKIYTWGNSAYGQLGSGPLIMQAGISARPTLVTIGPSNEESEKDLDKALGRFTSRDFSQPSCSSLLEDSLKIVGDILESGISQENSRGVLLAKKVSCGGMHTAAVTLDGEVYCWGRADSGQLGIGYAWIQEMSQSRVGMEWPQFCSELKDECVVDVSCGAFHTVILTDLGKVYSWGKEDHGQLGCSDMGLATGSLNKPHLVAMGNPRVPNDESYLEEKAHTASLISSGGWHTVVISRSGIPWACGRGEYGRLGMENDASKKNLAPIPFFEEYPFHVLDVSSGGSHTLVLTEDGMVFSFGRAGDGRLGLDKIDSVRQISVPTPVSALYEWSNKYTAKVVQISAGGNHSAALLVKTETL